MNINIIIIISSSIIIIIIIIIITIIITMIIINIMIFSRPKAFWNKAIGLTKEPHPKIFKVPQHGSGSPRDYENEMNLTK